MLLNKDFEGGSRAAVIFSTVSVKTGKALNEHMFSGLAPNSGPSAADSGRTTPGEMFPRRSAADRAVDTIQS
jgi:hypothetical protein